jgi:hypothetical protein
LGIGDWGLGPIPNPQSPIPNPQIIIIQFKNLENNLFFILLFFSKIFIKLILHKKSLDAKKNFN